MRVILYFGYCKKTQIQRDWIMTLYAYTTIAKTRLQ